MESSWFCLGPFFVCFGVVLTGFPIFVEVGGAMLLLDQWSTLRWVPDVACCGNRSFPYGLGSIVVAFYRQLASRCCWYRRFVSSQCVLARSTGSTVPTREFCCCRRR